MAETVLGWLTKWWDFVDNRGIVRRLILAVAFSMTVWVTLWAMKFSEISAREGLEVAAIIAAVTAPVTLLCTSVYRAYLDSKPT